MSLSEIFVTPTLSALLTVFALHPERWFYQKELVALTGGSLYLVQRELKRLESVGLIDRRPRGRQVEYRANARHAGFPGLRDSVVRTIGLGDILRHALAQVPSVKAAFVFGSVAAGSESAASDLDIFVMGDLGIRDVAEALMPAVSQLGREPNIVVFSEGEVRQRLESGEHFMTTIMREPKMWLVGDEGDLEAVLGQPSTTAE